MCVHCRVYIYITVQSLIDTYTNTYRISLSAKLCRHSDARRHANDEDDDDDDATCISSNGV